MDRKFLFIFALSIAFIIGILVGVFISAIKYKDCLGNTISYGIGKLEGDMILSCYCNFNDFRYERLFINSTGIYPISTAFDIT